MSKHQPIVIEVRYYRNPPTVKIGPLGVNVEVKLIDTLEESTLLMEHKGISIYWAIKEEQSSDAYFKSEYLVSVNSGQDMDNGDVFDVRDLPLIPPKKQGKYMKLFPQERDMAHEWKRRLAYQIDEGHIRADECNAVAAE